MLTFFQHFFIGKMEEETQNDEEVVDQEQTETEHSDETANPDNAEHVDETTEEEVSGHEQLDSDTDVSIEATESPESEDNSQQQDVEVGEVVLPPDSDADETPEEISQVENVTKTEESDTEEVPEQEEAPEIIVIPDTTDPSEVVDVSVNLDLSDTEETPEVIVIPDEVESSKVEATSEVEEGPVPSEKQITYDLGKSEELYNFVDKFEESDCSGTEQISANMADIAGGITKPALFAHPSSSDAARIVYQLTLPEVEKDESLYLYFSIGLRDGVIFDDPQRQPGGVRFSIDISGENCFDAVSTECNWHDNGVDITQYAGKDIELTFITRCNVEGNSSYAWALWGQPKLLKLTPIEVILPQPPEIQCGIAIAKLSEDHVTSFEFDQGSFTPASEIAAEIYDRLDVQPVELTLYAAQAKLEIVSVGTTSAVVCKGEAYEVQCTIKNVGAGPLGKDTKTRLTLHDIKLRRGRSSHNLKTLAPGDTATYIWYARGVSRQTDVNFSVSLKSTTLKLDERVKNVIQIRPPQPKLDNQVVSELHTYMHGEHVVFGNKNLRFILVHNGEQSERSKTKSSREKNDIGYEYISIYVAKGNAYQQIAITKMIAEATYLSKDKVENINFIPNEVQLAGNSLGESIVRLTGEHKDLDGVTWTLQLQLILTEDVKRVKVGYQLTVDGDRDLLAFRAAEIYAGHKSTRDKKTAALFPGLEFLEGDEPSSSERDAAPPINNRLVPHPYKITIPVMAVEMQKSVVGIVWDPLQSWDGQAQNVSAVFASPNWLHQERNHLMGIFLPTVPEWVKENTLVAQTPYHFTPERQISVSCEIIADGNTTILDAVSHWTSAYGSPEPLDPPRNDEAEVLLSRHGLMHTVWDEEARQSRHCVDWQSNNEPGFATLLWYDYMVTKDESVKERVREIAEKIIAETGAASLASRGSCHILSGEFPFYYGYLEAALDHYQSEVQPVLESQADDGSWGFHPASEKTEKLGKTGDVVLGTCAAQALKLLKHARIIGSSTSLEAGRKALSFMDRFSVPRGAQVWECPLYEPDILAAAHAVGAYVEAYEITGSKTYLKRAAYWAETGLPFLYHWHMPDRPGMQFASIPVFGTTFYTHSWFGVPVQWNGLVYAYYLQRLNQYVEDKKWHKIAEGITISAMYQQWEDGELKGTYPDGFYGYCTERKGPHINPEDIMVNVYMLSGLDPGVKTKVHGSIHLSSGATPETITKSKNGELKWTLNYAENETSYTLVIGNEKTPSLIRAQIAEGSEGRDDSPFDIPQVDTLENVTSGWRYLTEKDAILIKQIHITNEMQFQLLNNVE